jgi:hypothetical protein
MSIHTDVYHRSSYTARKKKMQNTFPRRHGQNEPARDKKHEGASEDGTVNLKYDNQWAGTTCAFSTESTGKDLGATRDKSDSQKLLLYIYIYVFIYVTPHCLFLWCNVRQNILWTIYSHLTWLSTTRRPTFLSKFNFPLCNLQNMVVLFATNLPSTPSLIVYGFRKIYPWGSNSWSVILVTVQQVISRFSKSGLWPPRFPIHGSIQEWLKVVKTHPKRSGASRVLHWPQLGLRIVKYTYIITFRRWKPNSNTLQPYRPQHNRPAACVGAQQYTSVTFVSLHSHSLKQEFDERFERVTSFFNPLLIS